MAARRRRPSSLADLPTELAIRIAGRVTAISVRPMEDLRSLRATCHFMRRVCSDPEVGRLISVERFYKLYRYVVPDGYLTLLPRLAQVGYDEGAATTEGGWEGAATARRGWEGAGEPPAPLGAISLSGGSSLRASERDGHPRSIPASTGRVQERRRRVDPGATGSPTPWPRGETP